MTSDDEVRRALHEFVDGDYGQPDVDAIRGGFRRARRVGNTERLLVAAVVLLVVAGAVFVVLRNYDGGRQQTPIDQPTPVPSQTSTWTPTPEPSPTEPSPEPTPTKFEVNPGSGVNPGPVGGVGDELDGLRLDDVQISTGLCGSETCPASFEFTVTNVSGKAGRWELFGYVYRNGFATLGNAGQIELSTGESGTLIITLDISRAPTDGPAGDYTWNWSATRLK